MTTTRLVLSSPSETQEFSPETFNVLLASGIANLMAQPPERASPAILDWRSVQETDLDGDFPSEAGFVMRAVGTLTPFQSSRKTAEQLSVFLNSVSVSYPSFKLGGPGVTAVAPEIFRQIREVFERAAGRLRQSRDMVRLHAAAEAADDATFRSVARGMDWSYRSPEDFVSATQMALRVGAHLMARELASEGAKRHPKHETLRKYAKLLAPPRVIRTDLPPDPSATANRTWLRDHAQQYRGRCVAIRNGKLIAVADSLAQLQQKIAKAPRVLITKVF